jgi:DNA polymerase III epsilon subunit family exonuclease
MAAPRSRTSRPQNIDDTDFTVIDFETTGLSPDRGDRVCEVGAVRLRGGAVVDEFSTLIDPRRPVSAGAYAVNRISPSMLAGAPPFEEIAARMQQMISGSVLVAYNAPFDMSFLRHELRLAGYPAAANPVVDVLPLARKLLPGLGRYPQENVARVTGISRGVSHRAFEDTMITARLFLLFSAILKAHDLCSVDDLTRDDIMQVIQGKRMSIIRSALEGKLSLWIKYLSAPEGEITERIVTPLTLLDDRTGMEAYSHLRAICQSAGTELNFRLDRILDTRPIPGNRV